MHFAQGINEYVLLLGGVVFFSLVVLSLLISFDDNSGMQANNSTASILCRQEADLDSSNDCDGGLNNRIVALKDGNYSCSGIYPNCTATYLDN